jgi:hypothetical protein
MMLNLMGKKISLAKCIKVWHLYCSFHLIC